MIVLEDVVKVYRAGSGTVRALGPVTMRVTRGEAVAVVGRSGAGKSTLLSILGCLERPTRGRYLLDGVSISDLSEAELARFRRERLGFGFQRFHLIDELNVAQNVELPLIYRGWPRAARRQAVVEILDRLGLAGKGNVRPSQVHSRR